MPLPWRTARRWTIAVAIVALAQYLWIQEQRTARRRTALRQTMMNHAILAGAYRGEPVGCVYTDEQIRVLRACTGKPNAVMAAYHEALRQKYRRAREHPWLPVPPDPPPPE